LTLAEYFHAVYQPSRGLAMNYRMAHENAIRTFNRFAGEELQVEQITPTLLAMFNDWMNAKQGYSRHTSMMYRRIMRNLLSAASPERFPPPPSIEQEQREEQRPKAEPAPLPAPPIEATNGTLTPEEYFWRMVYPRLSDRTRRDYTASVRAFTLFKPGPTPPAGAPRRRRRGGRCRRRPRS
jgi:hypothetical protein